MNGVIQSKSKGLKTKGANDVNPRPQAGADDMSQLKL